MTETLTPKSFSWLMYGIELKGCVRYMPDVFRKLIVSGCSKMVAALRNHSKLFRFVRDLAVKRKVEFVKPTNTATTDN